MSSIRLTNNRRGEIERLLMDKAFKERRQALKNEASRLGNACIDHALGEHKATVESLPHGYMIQQMQIYARRYDEQLRLHHTRRISTEWQYGVVLEERGKEGDTAPASLHDELDAHFVSVKQLEKDEAETAQEIRGVLNSVTTMKKLFEVWPALAEVYTVNETDGGSTGTALVKNVEALNALLKIPKKEYENGTPA